MRPYGYRKNSIELDIRELFNTFWIRTFIVFVRPFKIFIRGQRRI